MSMTKIRQQQVMNLKTVLDEIKNQIKTFKPPVNTINELPLSGNDDGDLRVCLADGNVYIWYNSNSEWKLNSSTGSGGSIGNIKICSFIIDSDNKTEINTKIKLDENTNYESIGQTINLYLNGLLLERENYTVKNVNQELVIEWKSSEPLLKEDIINIQYFDGTNSSSQTGSNYVHPETHPASMIILEDGKNVEEEIKLKLDKVEGKVLSSNDYTNEEKTKLQNIAENANKYVHPDTHPASMITDLHECATTGNATTAIDATKAMQDSAGQQIDTTYIKDLSVSGTTITYTRGDYTTGKITTQDTNTTYSLATINKDGLMSADDKSAIINRVGRITHSYNELFNDFSTNKNNNGCCSHAEGRCTTTNGNYCHAEGYGTTASGDSSHAEGYGTTASGDSSHAEGCNTKASGKYSHAQGNNTTTLGECSYAGGYNSTVSNLGIHGFAHGNNCYATSSYGTAFGEYSYCYDYAGMCIGRYNIVDRPPSSSYSSTANAFIIGNGNSDARSHAFRVTFDGKAYGLSAFNSTGADYAEYFEWEDGNINNEDRIGLFVTLEGDKIKIANENDFILGIISGNPSVIGNSVDDQWYNMYVRDKFGVIQYEEIEIEDHKELAMKLNPNYDPNQTYIPRSQRSEWGVVGMLGQLVVIDDGTCQVNGYCNVGANGIATKTDTGYRVLKRIDDTTILVLFK